MLFDAFWFVRRLWWCRSIHILCGTRTARFASALQHRKGSSRNKQFYFSRDWELFASLLSVFFYWDVRMRIALLITTTGMHVLVLIDWLIDSTNRGCYWWMNEWIESINHHQSILHFSKGTYYMTTVQVLVLGTKSIEEDEKIAIDDEKRTTGRRLRIKHVSNTEKY